jgi:hypothetical protein
MFPLSTHFISIFMIISVRLTGIIQMSGNLVQKLMLLCAGPYLANAKWSMMEAAKKTTHAGGTLQKVNPGTADAARKTANKVITGVLSSIAAKHDDNMDTTGAGTAGIFHEERGTAGSSYTTWAGTAGTGPGTSADTPAITAILPPVYCNFHDDDDGEAQKRRGTTARYESIRTQRQIRGEHEAIGSGPTADCFECGDFFAKDDLRTQMSVLVEDSRELIISSSSFVQDDWTCISCDKAHPLLPLKTEKNN